jgi:hypothetical protein
LEVPAIRGAGRYFERLFRIGSVSQYAAGQLGFGQFFDPEGSIPYDRRVGDPILQVVDWKHHFPYPSVDIAGLLVTKHASCCDHYDQKGDRQTNDYADNYSNCECHCSGLLLLLRPVPLR